jgi:hypothetical protein
MVIEQALCWVFAFLILGLGYRFVHKEKYKLATFCLIVAVGCLLCGQSWFQGLMKTGIIRVVRTTLQGYGNRLNDFQKETEQMRTELDEQQSQLRTQQQKIGEQQGELETAQKVITEQQKKIDDVEFLQKNLFANIVNEEISGADTNRVAVEIFTNGVQRVALKLKHVPIRNSVQSTFQSPGNFGVPFPMELRTQFTNIVFTYFADTKDPTDVKLITFWIQYVRDTRATNTFSKLEFRDGFFHVDDHPLRLLNPGEVAGRPQTESLKRSPE